MNLRWTRCLEFGSWSLFGAGCWVGGVSPRGQLFRQPNRRDHARWIGDAFPRDIVGRAVIRRGANERKSERPVHAALEADHLERHQPLIVIHRDYRIVVATKD